MYILLLTIINVISILLLYSAYKRMVKFAKKNSLENAREK